MQKFIRKYLFLSLFILLIVYTNAQEIIVSVSDFNVESENKKFKYIGKGISTLVAGELRRNKAIKLLERAKMSRIMEEQKLSLSGLVEDSQQVELGKLMAADYIVFGEIIDMGNSLLISVRMADVATSEIVWEDSLTEKLETYDYIGAYFAQSILKELKLDVKKETIAKVETKVVKKTEAIVALSDGIDAYDKGDEKKAKKKLKAVQMLDPENEVADFYLSKLQAVSPKFQVEIRDYSPVFNPASIGFIKSDKIYFWGSGDNFTPPGVEKSGSGPGATQKVGEYYVGEFQGHNSIGYLTPIGERIGIGLGFLFSVQQLDISRIDGSEVLEFNGDMISGINQFMMNLGGSVSLGIRLEDWFSIGTSVFLWQTAPGDFLKEGLYFSVCPGLMLQEPSGNLTFDISAAYTNQNIYYTDYPAGKVVLGSLPLILDSSFTYMLPSRRTFLGIKGISDIYLDDRGGYALRLIPMVEFWPYKFFSVRGGYEYSHLDQSGTFTIGQGAVGGFTVKVGKFDIDANVTYRQKPSILLPGTTVAYIKLLIGMEFTPGWVNR